MQNLTTLANIKQWVGGSSGMSATDDALLTRLIGAASGQIMTFLSRPSLFKNSVVTKVTGNGGTVILLPQWPVLSVTQLLINGTVIPSSNGDPTKSGWLLEAWDGFSAGTPQRLMLNGYNFSSSLNAGLPYVGAGSPVNDGFSRVSSGISNPLNVEIDYITGYTVSGEAQTIPVSPYQLSTLGTLGTWGQDDGVTIAGVAATKVTSAPAAGQYSVSSAGLYTFAAADTGKTAAISYSYIPAPVEQACIEMVAERYSYKDRTGQRTKSMPGMTTTSYNLAGMTDAIAAMLQPYRRVMMQR